MIILFSIFYPYAILNFPSEVKIRHTKESYDVNTIMKMLVYSRILAPAPKKSSVDNLEIFFEKNNYSLDDVYRFLS